MPGGDDLFGADQTTSTTGTDEVTPVTTTTTETTTVDPALTAQVDAVSVETLAYDADSCPSPAATLAEALEGFAHLVHDKACADAKVNADERAKLQTEIETIKGSLLDPSLPAKLEALKKLVEELDFDGSGSIVNELTTIISKADDALKIAEEARTKAELVAAEVSSLQSVIIAINSSITNLTQSIESNSKAIITIDTKATKNATDIADLTKRVDELKFDGGVTIEDVDKRICMNNKAFASAVTPLLDSLKAILNAPCEI